MLTGIQKLCTTLQNNGSFLVLRSISQRMKSFFRIYRKHESSSVISAGTGLQFSLLLIIIINNN